MPRIGCVVSNVIKPSSENESSQWNLGIVPLNFSKMIAQEIQPIVGKKIA